MKFTAINSAACVRFRAETVPMLNTVLQPFGLMVDIPGTMSFTGTEMTAKVRIMLADPKAADALLERKKAEYKFSAKLLGLPEDSFGKKFIFRRNVYEVAGLAGGRSAKVDIKNLATGKLYRMDAAMVASSLKTSPALFI